MINYLWQIFTITTPNRCTTRTTRENSKLSNKISKYLKPTCVPHFPVWISVFASFGISPLWLLSHLPANYKVYFFLLLMLPLSSRGQVLFQLRRDNRLPLHQCQVPCVATIRPTWTFPLRKTPVWFRLPCYSVRLHLATFIKNYQSGFEDVLLLPPTCRLVAQSLPVMLNKWTLLTGR